MAITRHDITRAISHALHDLEIYVDDVNGDECYAGHVETVRTWPDTATDVVEFDLTTGRTVKLKISFPRTPQADKARSEAQEDNDGIAQSE